MIFYTIVHELNPEGKGTQSQPISGALQAYTDLVPKRIREAGIHAVNMHCFGYITMLQAPLWSYLLRKCERDRFEISSDFVVMTLTCMLSVQGIGRRFVCVFLG